MFTNLFELARGVKQYTYYISHFRSKIKSAKNDAVEKAYNLTEQINNYKSRTK